jgi:hypothetical protein
MLLCKLMWFVFNFHCALLAIMHSNLVVAILMLTTEQIMYRRQYPQNWLASLSALSFAPCIMINTRVNIGPLFQVLSRLYCACVYAVRSAVEP